MASATHAPSRNSSSVWIAGCQHEDGIRSTIRWTLASTGNPNENSTPCSTHASANVCVAPAESERASTRGDPGSPGRGRACGSSAARASLSTVTWSAAVFDPAFPGRSKPARASPPAMSGRSRKHSNGWNPNVFFHVAAAFSFSLCAIVIVASKSSISPPVRSGPAPAAQAASRALARAACTNGSRAASTRSSSRHVVGIDATGPNNSCRSVNTSIPLIASAPSATATAISVNTRPGACTHGPRYVSASTAMTASTRPVYSATSRNNPTPAWDTTPAPSALTLTRRDRLLLFTSEVPVL